MRRHLLPQYRGFLSAKYIYDLMNVHMAQCDNVICCCAQASQIKVCTIRSRVAAHLEF